MSDRGFKIIDCDTHCYEPPDAVTRYLPKEFLDRTITPMTLPNGDCAILAGRSIATFNGGRHDWDEAYRPGSLKEMLRQMGSGTPEEAYVPERVQIEYLEREPRLALLEKQGVEKCVLFPGELGLAAEHWVKDTEALFANVHSFNRWYDETWGFNYQDRLYATPVISLRDLDLAVREVEWVLDRGAHFVLFPTGPANGRSPGDPYFDPIWSRMNEAGAVAAFHIMPHWYFDAISPAWGLNPDPGSWSMSAWQWQHVYGERPIQETISALIFDNLFGRFPNLRILSAEHGAEWIPHFATLMDKSRGMGRKGPWIGGRLTERPSEILRRHVRVVPYPEDNIPWIAENLGQTDSLVMGSDFPHAEGLASPADFQSLLASLTTDVQRKILHDNAAELCAAG
ncbi:MAG TPA: amidohydrolase family protein [Acidimicrobiales bacterium]|jgi:predicted TIM-barrel fold metal-dependent hydrolase|nr:amidohydrolase family protein [Acidimicrobiales bacterium]